MAKQGSIETGGNETVRRSRSKRARLEIFNAAQGKCHICGRKIQVTEQWEVEHIIPLAMGGEDAGSNLAPAHKSCHRQKTNEDLGNLARAKRRAAYHNHTRISKTPLPFGKQSKWKRKLNGKIVSRDDT